MNVLCRRQANFSEEQKQQRPGLFHGTFRGADFREKGEAALRWGIIQWDVQRRMEENLHQVEHGLQTTALDVAVLPEMCLSGYLFQDAAHLAQAAREAPLFLEALEALSRQYDCAIIAGLPRQKGKRVYNSAAVVDAGHCLGFYDKLHLSDLEKKLFTPGEKNRVFTIRGVTVGVSICFDLWFPEVYREQTRMGAQLFCCPANFGGPQTLSVAAVRAMENAAPLVLCNRTGTERMENIQADFRGESGVFSSSGQRLTPEATGFLAAGAELSFPAVRGNVICRDLLAEVRRHEPIHTNKVGDKTT